MRIFIITMDDPIQTKTFIKKIIDARINDIVGIAISKGDRLTLSKGKSKFLYLLSLLLIMGPFHFLKNAFITSWHKIRKLGHKFSLCEDPSILSYARKIGIHAFNISSPNNSIFINKLISFRPDIIINQSQSIIRKNLLEIPTIGILNRHNALLPKNRGRLTPFWVLYKEEKETGVSIHFIDNGLDSGSIIVQEKFSVLKSDNFNSLVKKNYEIAPLAMIKALNLLENGFKDFMPNDDLLATYNTTPTLSEAWTYRKKRFSLTT